MIVNTKGDEMFLKKQLKKVESACDSLCRAERLRDEALFKAALLGPRL